MRNRECSAHRPRQTNFRVLMCMASISRLGQGHFLKLVRDQMPARGARVGSARDCFMLHSTIPGTSLLTLLDRLAHTARLSCVPTHCTSPPPSLCPSHPPNPVTPSEVGARGSREVLREQGLEIGAHRRCERFPSPSD